MNISWFCRVIACLVGCSATAYPAERHLRYDGDAYRYEIAFDDSRISAAEMRQIAWLSPWVDL
jgi:hypothetical protein